MSIPCNIQPGFQFTVYPCDIDSSDQLPLIVDNKTPVKAEIINRHREAILAIESELGVNPSSTFTTVRARLDALEALIDNLSGAGNPGIDVIKKDNIDIVTGVRYLNFIGDSVTITDAGGNQADVTISVVNGVIQVQETRAVTSNGQTIFTLSDVPTDDAAVLMFVNGIKQQYGVDYIISNAVVTYANNPALIVGDIVEFWYIISSTITQTQETIPVGVNGQVQFTLSSVPSSETSVMMFINGLKQQNGIDYNISNDTVNYFGTTTIETDDVVEFWYIVSGGGGSGGGSPQNLSQVLTVGNTSAGHDIDLTGGSKIISSDGNIVVGGDLEIIGDGYVSNDFEIAGKLTVHGLIDPTGLVLTVQNTKPVAGTADTGVLWVDSNKNLVFTNQDNVDSVVSDPGAVEVPDIQSLKAIDVGTTSLVFVSDIGGGHFYWDPLSSETDDGAIIITPNDWANDGRWKRVIHDSVYNITWFGARGDDLTDNTTALNSALSAIPADGGTLYIPAGVYLLSSVVQIPDKKIKIIGQGTDVTVLKGPESSENCFNFGVGNVQIQFVQFTGWQHSIVFSDTDGVNDVSIKNCSFTGNSGYAVNVSSSNVPISNILIENCSIKNQVNGIDLRSAVISNVVVKNNNIENLTNVSGGVMAISVGGNVGDGYNMMDIDVSGNLIRNLSGAGETHAILCYGHRVIISNNRIDTVENSSGDCEAIYTKCRMGVVYGNVIRNGGSTSGGAIQIKGSARTEEDTPAGYTMRVFGNTIVDDRASINAYGISVFRGELDVSHNVIEGTGGAAIYLAPGNVENVSITDNEIINCRAQSGIEIRNDKKHILIARNRVHSISDGDAIRILIATTESYVEDIVIEGNFIYDIADGHGIHLSPQIGGIHRAVVRNNTIDIKGTNRRTVQVSATNASRIVDLVCENNRYITNPASTNLLSTTSSTAGLFPVIRDYSSIDKFAFFGENPIVKPTLTGSVLSNSITDSLLSALDSFGIINNNTTSSSSIDVAGNMEILNGVGNFKIGMAPQFSTNISELANGNDDTYSISLINDGIYNFVVSCLVRGDSSGDYYQAYQTVTILRESAEITVLQESDLLNQVGMGIELGYADDSGDFAITITNTTGEEVSGYLRAGYSVEDLI